MLRTSLRHVAGTRFAVPCHGSIRAAFPPLRPVSPLSFGQAHPFAVRTGIDSARCPDVRGSLVAVSNEIEPHRSSGSQLRHFHTSRPAYARASFGKKLKDRIQRFRQDPNATNKLAGIGAMGYTLAKMSKFGAIAKYAFPILKLAKAGPLLSMGLSTLFYSWFFGLPFAVGIVSLLFTSQASRAMLLHRLGCEVQPMMMIPFFGTMNYGSENTDYTKTEDYVLRDKPFERCLVALSSVAGMFLFTATVPHGVGGLLLESQCGLAVANTGYMMAMFSQLPLGEMTPGGLLLSHFSKRALLYGTVFNFALIFVMKSPILIMCLLLNLYRLYQRGFVLFGRQFGGADSEPNYDTGFGVSRNVFTDRHKLIIASLYWALFIGNAAGMTLVANSLYTPQRLRQQQQMEVQQRRHDLGQDGFGQHGENQAPAPAADGFGSDSGGWNMGDWALGNLAVVEEAEDNFDKEWERQQRFYDQQSNESFRDDSRYR